jgi:hypothetical protein
MVRRVSAAAFQEHDPEKMGTGFPSRQARSVCPEIMIQEKDEMIRFNLIGS